MREYGVVGRRHVGISGMGEYGARDGRRHVGGVGGRGLPVVGHPNQQQGDGTPQADEARRWMDWR